MNTSSKRYKSNRNSKKHILSFNVTKSRLNHRSRNSNRTMRNVYSIRTEKNIIIPKWAKIKDYRTMTSEKKDLAVSGDEKSQIEWMMEEVNEFYEAVQKKDIEEIRDEAIGLIRTYQQFQQSNTVVKWWKIVRKDVVIVFRSRKIFMDTFAKWHAKKLKKNQARDVVPEDLIAIAGLKW